jgi:hypothetical protein
MRATLFPHLAHILLTLMCLSNPHLKNDFEKARLKTRGGVGRAGWAAAARIICDRIAHRLLDPPTPHTFDEKEWKCRHRE